eukprot:1958051-Prorocentrum_lima.AAC.1
MERFSVLVKLITKLKKKYPHVGHRLDLIKYSREARTPSVEMAMAISRLVNELGVKLIWGMTRLA